LRQIAKSDSLLRTAPMSNWVIDTGDRDFEAAVIARSAETPVVVDFWAPWCGPCRTLGPLLERLADEHHGVFLLAKVNVDENPELSAALNIQSIPMVLGFRDRQVVAEFVGAVPEAAVREFLKKVLPSEADHLAVAGEQLAKDGKTAEAEASFRRALETAPRHDRALLGLASILAERAEHEDSLQLLERVGSGPWRQHADHLAAEIRLRQGGGASEAKLRALIAVTPADLDTRLLLGRTLAANGQYEDALREFLEIVRRDRDFQDGAARKAMLDIFELLEPQHELTSRYRSELAKVLFR
jgi:putative thioredoxin